MKQGIQYASGLVIVITLLVWGFNALIQPVLPPAITDSILAIIIILLAVIATLSNFKDIVDLFKPTKDKQREYSPSELKDYREILLTRVWNSWIEGFLKNSLYNEVRFELGLEIHNEFLANPWDTVLQISNQPPVSVPPLKKIIDVFNESSKSLLILGEPGSGKTTELLELASQAIEVAKNDSNQPIPVVLNLSTWKSKTTIKEWFVSELWERYKISEKLGTYWVEKNKLLYLLDGLDEIQNEFRDPCVLAINEFLKEQIAPLVICCRKDEFEELTEKLNFHSAVLIQPLTENQTKKYLQTNSPEFVAIYSKIVEDSTPETIRFIHTPLFLSILILAYRDAPAQDIERLIKSKVFKRHLFDYYIETMFKRRGKRKLFTENQTKYGLAWLARQMIKYGLTVFYIDNIEDSWIEKEKQGKIYKFLVNYSSLLITGLIAGLSIGLATELRYGLIGGIFGGLMTRLILWDTEDFRKPNFATKWSWYKSKKRLVRLFDVQDFKARSWLVIFLLLFGLLVALAYGLILGLVIWLVILLSFMLVFGFGFGIISENTRKEIEIQNRPDQSIKNSLKFGLIYGFITGLVLGLFIGLVLGLFLGLSAGLVYGLVGGLIIWLVGGLILGFIFFLSLGGVFLLDHFALRGILYYTAKIPFRLITFLEFATERVFLRRVGGGYIFIHRMVMEHFAEMVIVEKL